jgi:hypothetical protein
MIVTGDGSGTNPYVVTSNDPAWAGTSPSGSINIGNLGPNAGHSPTFDVNVSDAGGIIVNGNGELQIEIDPASGAPISLGPAGLRVDCCPTEGNLAVDDTSSVNLTYVGALLSADVIPNGLAGIEVTASGVGVKLENDPAPVAPGGGNLSRFTTAGDLTVPQTLVDARADARIAALVPGLVPQFSGVNASNVGSGVQVNLATTVGASSGNSLVYGLTNISGVPLLVDLNGIGTLEASSSGGNVNRVFSHQMVLTAVTLTGGAVQVSNAGLHSFSDLGNGPGTIPADVSIRARGLLRSVVFMPPGSSAVWNSFATCLENQAGWTSTVAAGAFYQIANVYRIVHRVKDGAAWGLA